MACSRRLFWRGVKMPGVSTKMSWASSLTVMPRMRRRVVCTFGVTIETLVPTSRFKSVDFPTFGAPKIATKPQRAAALTWASSDSGGVGKVFPVMKIVTQPPTSELVSYL